MSSDRRFNRFAASRRSSSLVLLDYGEAQMNW